MTTRIFVPIKVTLRKEIILSKSASHYLLNVLRAKAGMRLIIFNGQGGEYCATLVKADKKAAVLFIESKTEIDRESPVRIHLAQGVAKGDRMDYCIQKSTELGVSAITPVITGRSNVRLSADRMESKQQHWQQVAISAAEQCGRTKVPIVHSAVALPQLLSQSFAVKLIADTEASANLKTLGVDKEVMVLIGPEGGFAEEEITAAKQHNFQTFSLGPRVLRTETAGPVAIALLQSLYGDLA